MSEAFTQRLQRDLEHCPALTGTAPQRAYQGDADALQFAEDIRELDPRQVWGAVNRLGKTDPERLLAAFISLAARVDPTEHGAGLPPAWAAGIGGIPALHPDFKPEAPVSRKPTRPDRVQQAMEIARLAESGVTDIDIARRLGLPLSTVERMRCAAGVFRRRGRAPKNQRVA